MTPKELKACDECEPFAIKSTQIKSIESKYLIMNVTTITTPIANKCVNAAQAERRLSKAASRLASTEAKEALKAAKVQEKKTNPGKKSGSKKAKAVAVPLVVLAPPAVLVPELEFEEEEEIQVEEVEWRGRSYLVADDGTLFDDAHAAVGRWPDHATAGSAPVWAE